MPQQYSDLPTGHRRILSDPGYSDLPAGAVAVVPKEDSPDRSIVADTIGGIGSGVLSAIFHGGDLIRRGLGMERVIDKPEVQSMITAPDSTAGRLGKGAEQLGEFFIPAGAVAKGGKAWEAATTAAKLSPRVAATLNLAGRAALEGAAAGGVTAAQSGSLEEGAKAGAFAGGLSGAFGAGGAAFNRLAPKVRPQWNALEQKAMDAAERMGIKLSLGQKTGNEAMRRMERGLVTVPGAAGTAESFFRNQEGQIVNAGEGLLKNALPAGKDTAIEAGQSVADRLAYKIKQAKSFADKKYSQVRSIMENPRNASTVQVGTKTSQLVDEFGVNFQSPINRTFNSATDLNAAKSKLGLVVDELSKTMPEFQQQSSPGYAALRNIVNGEGTLDALTVDQNLSAIKAMLREGGGAAKYLSNNSKRLATQTIGELESALNKSLTDAGGRAVEKLQAGRAAVKRYHSAAEFLASLPKNATGELEPAAVYKKLTTGGDLQINLLKDLHTLAPKEVEELGHTFVRGMLDKATAEGGFSRAAGLMQDWNRMGPATKNLLIGDKAKQEAIDSFFLAAKRLTADPNPSGTGKLITALGPIGIALDMSMSPGTLEDKAKRLPVELAALGGVAAMNRALARVLLEKQGAPLFTAAMRANPNSALWMRARSTLNAMFSQAIQEQAKDGTE
jgi:hypothetical protein